VVVTAPGRYRLTLTVDGHAIADGWWGLHATADGRMKDWIGLHGRDGARIELVDTETGDVIRSWP
jgi:hypothetical protein